MTKKERKRKKEFKRLLAKFSHVLLNKLLANERKYKFGDSWKVPNWEHQLQRDLAHHVQKGDPRDTAIFSLFAWYHNWPTASSVPAYSDSELIDLLPQNLTLYRDSGSWQIRSDNMEIVLFQQNSTMTFHDFLIGSIENVGTRWDDL